MPFVGVPRTPMDTPRPNNFAQTPRMPGPTQIETNPTSATLQQIILGFRGRIADMMSLTDELSRLTSKSALHSTPLASHTVTTPRALIFEPVPALAPHSDQLSGFDTIAKKPCYNRSDSSQLSSVRISDEIEDMATGDLGSEEDEAKTSYAHIYSKDFVTKQEWLCSADSSGLNLAQRSAHHSHCSTVSFHREGGTFASDSSVMLAPAGSFISVDQGDGHMRKFISSPASPRRVAWELIGIALVLYDLLSIPLLLAFEPPSDGVVQVFDWIGRVFWTLNIPITLTTGYIHDGVMVLKFRRILRNYARTWLVVDFVTVIPDWLFLILSRLSSNDNEKDATTLMRLVNFIRLLRLARLMRIAKLRDAWNMMYDMIVSEKVGILLDVVKNILILMVVNHFIACLWFVISRTQAGNSWLKFHGYTKENIDWGHQYLISYHWSITQFASSMHVQPQSVTERSFAIAVVIFGMVGFAYVVGSITSSLAQLRAMDEKRATNMWHLRKFLNQEDIPHELCVRIKSYVESRWDKQQHTHSRSDFEVLELLSDNLKSELASAIHGPTVGVHPLFQEFQVHCRQTIQRFLHNGISTLALAPHDTMFTAGEHANYMAILFSGTMQYERMHLDSCYPEVVESYQDWVAEPVLWVVEWCHIGNLRSRTAAELLLIDPAKLYAICKLNPLAFMIMSHYCKAYVEWLNKFPKEYLSDISQGEDVGIELAEIIRDVLTKLSLRVSGNGGSPGRVSMAARYFAGRGSKQSRSSGESNDESRNALTLNEEASVQSSRVSKASCDTRSEDNEDSPVERTFAFTDSG